MKKLICTFIVLLNVLTLKAQHQIITVNGDTINSVPVGMQGEYFLFDDYIRVIDSKKIHLSEISTLIGDLSQMRRKFITKRYPTIEIIEEKIPDDYVDDTNTVATPTDYLFALTNDGFKNNRDKTKDFVVVEFPDKSQSDLFTAVLTFAHSTYVSPKDVISKMESELITINGYSNNLFSPYFAGYEVNYTIVFQFKDERIRISAPNINRISSTSRYGLDERTIRGLFNKEGEPTYRKEIINAETYFEALLRSLLDSILSKDDNW